MVNKERYIFWKKEEEKLEGFLKSDANYEKLKSWVVNYQVQSSLAIARDHVAACFVAKQGDQRGRGLKKTQ